MNSSVENDSAQAKLEWHQAKSERLRAWASFYFLMQLCCLVAKVVLFLWPYMGLPSLLSIETGLKIFPILLLAQIPLFTLFFFTSSDASDHEVMAEGKGPYYML